ncbi:hypothetical protein TIFTF001_004808 [Ficus carica]|uniref:Uncharacterized protein n=1 Tax=Ficus carica TaxID=3494 RepID=A0AA88CTR6_FICCA|nr:hypothetical protein TIFTF001_004808 [Ficus carica]
MVSANVGTWWMIGSCICVDMPGGYEFLTGVRRLVLVEFELSMLFKVVERGGGSLSKAFYEKQWNEKHQKCFKAEREA